MHIWLIRSICIAATAILFFQLFTLLTVSKGENQSKRLQRLKWLAGAACVYSLSTTVASFPFGPLGLFEASWLAYGIAGMLAFVLYARFMSTRLGVEIPASKWLYGTVTLAISSFVLMFIDIYWWQSETFYLSRHASLGANLFLDQNQVNSPSMIVQIAIASTVPFNIWCSIRFLRAAHGSGNRIVTIGILFNFLVLLNDALFGLLINKYLMPLSFLGYSIEITFYTFEQIRRYELHRQDLENAFFETSKEAEVGSMVGQICHDIRNPTAILDGWIKVLQQSSHSPEMKKILDSMEHSVLRIESTIADYLNYLRSDSSSEKEDLVLKKIIDQAFSFTAHKAREVRNVRIYMSISEDIRVHFRENSLLSLFINLISNSYDALSDVSDVKRSSNWIYIEAFRIGDDGFLEILVKDSGPGVPLEQRDSLFRRKLTSKKRGSGTGIGLRFVARILSLEGGSIRYDQDAVHTTFVLRLPISKDSHRNAKDERSQKTAAA